MSCFKPNILSKKEKLLILDQKNLGSVFGGSKCSKLLKNAIFTHFDPQKHPKKIILTQNWQISFFRSMFGLK